MTNRQFIASFVGVLNSWWFNFIGNLLRVSRFLWISVCMFVCKIFISNCWKISIKFDPLYVEPCKTVFSIYWALKNCLFNFWNHGKLSVDLCQIVQILQFLIDLASYEISIDLTFQVNWAWDCMVKTESIIWPRSQHACEHSNAFFCISVKMLQVLRTWQ